jgi:chromosome segregation and condensation protein ScpB
MTNIWNKRRKEHRAVGKDISDKPVSWDTVRKILKVNDFSEKDVRAVVKEMRRAIGNRAIRLVEVDIYGRVRTELRNEVILTSGRSKG